MSAAQSLPLAPGDVSIVQFIIMQTGVDFLFYGIQAALFIAASSMLARQENRSRIVTAAIVGLFLSSTIAVAVDVSFYVIQMPAFGAAPIDLVGLLTRMNIVIGVAFRFNYIVSDAIVVWRAWVLWPDSRLARALLLFCMTGSVVGLIIEEVWAVESLYSEEEPPLKTLMMTIPLLLTNVVATTLIGLQVWYFRRNVQGILGPWATTRVGKILVLLVESGLIYCLIWAVYLVINITEGPNTLAAYGVITAAYHSIAGIYPTFIVLVVAMQRSAAESICETRVSHSVHFASSAKGKGRSTDDTGTTTDTYTNAVEGVEDLSWPGHPPSGLETSQDSEHIMMSTISSPTEAQGHSERTDTRDTNP